MMVNRFLSAGVLFFLLACVADVSEEVQNNDWEANNLSGNVKEISQISYDYRNEDGQFRRIDGWSKFYFENYKETYNRSGNIVTRINYNYNEDVVWRHEYSYSEYMQNKEIRSYDKNGTLRTSERFYLDSLGYVLKWNKLDAKDKVRISLEYTYDNNRNCIKQIRINENKSNKVEYKYDEKNRKRAVLAFDTKNNLVQQINYVYNSNDDVIEVHTFNELSQKTALEKFEFIYDKKGNWEERRKIVFYLPDFIVSNIEMLTERKIQYF